jgi:hypothetical protein
MRQPPLRATLAGIGVSLLTALTQAAVPTFWRVSTEAEFLRGEVENLTVDGYGRLTLGPTTTLVYETSAPFLWTMVGGPDGSVFVGSGNEGQVFRIDEAGGYSVFFDAEELEVHAMAPIPGGGLYVGTSPDGKVYKVDASGRSTVLFDPPDKYIWSLAVDKAGNVYAGTGDKGVVYKIAPDGNGAPLYQTKATHAVALAFDREARLLVGTESPGRVFRIDSAGRPFVLLDSAYNEIHTLRVDPKGVIYAGAISGRAAAVSPAPRPAIEQGPSAPIPTVSTEITAIAVLDTPQALAPAPPPPVRTTQGQPTGAVYRIMPDGGSDLVWESREDSPYDLALESTGSVLVATGSKGKIYRLSGDPLQPTLVGRASAQQVTALFGDGSGRTLFATSNPGKVFRVTQERAARGTYISDVRDAETVAAWGAIKWQASLPSGAKVDISTRSGNTRTPDETWSDWSSVYTDPDGSAVTSPRARYLQWRAVLTGGSSAPVLTSVTAAYLPRNLRPRVTSITIHPPGTVFQRPFPTGDPEIAGFEGDLPDRRFTQQTSEGNRVATGPNLGRRAYERGLLTFVWRAEDDNRDELSYEIFYRQEGEAAWKLLKQGHPDAILVWDTTSVPNGRYTVKIVASDLLSNPPASALTGSMESISFEIDNTPPVIAVTSVRREGPRSITTFSVRDEHSSVQKVEYSLDGDRWQPVYPMDGIPDSRLEQYELTLEGDAAARSVILRAADALNNVSSARAEAPPSGRR